MNYLKDLFTGGASKFWVSVLGAVSEVIATGQVDWKTILVAAVSAALVYLVPNKSSTPAP